jgi:hypothetical protein
MVFENVLQYFFSIAQKTEIGRQIYYLQSLQKYYIVVNICSPL